MSFSVLIGVFACIGFAYLGPKLYGKMVSFIQRRRELRAQNAEQSNAPHQVTPPANPGSHFSLVDSDDEDLDAPILRRAPNSPRFHFARVSVEMTTFLILLNTKLFSR